VEALASGKPVIALGRGGSVEIVPPDVPSGVLYEDASEQRLERALAEFEAVETRVNQHTLQSWADGFSEPLFRREMAALIAGTAPSTRRYDSDLPRLSHSQTAAAGRIALP